MTLETGDFTKSFLELALVGLEVGKQVGGVELMSIPKSDGLQPASDGLHLLAT